jgi:hypothetical protein
MRHIYYPYVDIRDEDWLKFALLYLDEVIPIHPAQLYEFEDQYQLSDIYKKITQDTDLIRSHHVAEDDFILKDKTTSVAIEVLEDIFSNPNDYINIFHSEGFLDKWKNTEFQNFNLYGDKYTDEFRFFCEENNIAKYGPKGFYIPSEVGILYMSILAHDIGEQYKVSAITDNPLVDEMSIKLREAFSKKQKDDSPKYSSNATLTVAKGIIDIKLPKNLHAISLDKIIQLREKKNFKRNLHSFHSALENVLNLAEQRPDPQEVLDKFNAEYRDFIIEIAGLGLTTVSVGLGVWMAMQSSEVSPLNVTKEVLGVGGLSGVFSIKSKWNSEIAESKYTRKYLSDLSKLKK